METQNVVLYIIIYIYVYVYIYIYIWVNTHSISQIILVCHLLWSFSFSMNHGYAPREGDSWRFIDQAGPSSQTRGGRCTCLAPVAQYPPVQQQTAQTAQTARE